MQKTAAAVLFEEEDKLSLLRGDSLKEEKLAATTSTSQVMKAI
jgi:hypothetical protein